MVRTALLAALAAGLAGPFVGPAAAQPEVVPAEHRVYAWLADQRAAGRLPEFAGESLPTDRGAVRRHLDSLAVRSARLGPSGRYWLGQFRREFDEPLEAVHSYVGDGRAALLDPDAERFLAYSRSDEWRAAAWGEGSVEGRSAEGALGLGDAAGLSRSARLTFEANWRGRVGLYTSTVSGTQVTGDATVLLSDPALAPLYFVGLDSTGVQGPFDQTSASVRAVAGPFSAELANQRLRYGASAGDPLFVSDNAAYVPHVRLGLDTRWVTVEAVHAALSSRTRTVQTEAGDLFFEAPERYLAMTRLEVRPVSWLSGAFTEAVVYGRRGPELAYLLPLYPVEAAERAIWDRDNTLIAIEGVVRPARGVEAYGTWLVDDLAAGLIGEGSYGNKWAVQGGALVALGRTGATAFAEYTRIDPYTYTHRFREDGFFFNSFTHNSFGIGHPLGPNADQWLAGVRAWLPYRAWARVAGRYVRKGRNPVDPATGATVQVGGDVRVGTAPADGRKAFLAGDVFEGPGVEAEVEVEPFRGVSLRALADVQLWRQRPDRVFVRAGLFVRP